MKKMILSCVFGIAIALVSGCASSGDHKSATTTEKVSMPDLNTNTTSDIHAK